MSHGNIENAILLATGSAWEGSLTCVSGAGRGLALSAPARPAHPPVAQDGRRRIMPRRELLRHRRAADDGARFDDADLQSSAREIEGADKTVMPRTDDERVMDAGHAAFFAFDAGGAGVLGLYRHRSLTGQRQHSGVRALQT